MTMPFITPLFKMLGPRNWKTHIHNKGAN